MVGAVLAPGERDLGGLQEDGRRDLHPGRSRSLDGRSCGAAAACCTTFLGEVRLIYRYYITSEIKIRFRFKITLFTCILYKLPSMGVRRRMLESAHANPRMTGCTVAPREITVYPSMEMSDLPHTPRS